MWSGRSHFFAPDGLLPLLLWYLRFSCLVALFPWLLRLFNQCFRPGRCKWAASFGSKPVDTQSSAEFLVALSFAEKEIVNLPYRGTGFPHVDQASF